MPRTVSVSWRAEMAVPAKCINSALHGNNSPHMSSLCISVCGWCGSVVAWISTSSFTRGATFSVLRAATVWFECSASVWIHKWTFRRADKLDLNVFKLENFPFILQCLSLHDDVMLITLFTLTWEYSQNHRFNGTIDNSGKAWDKMPKWLLLASVVVSVCVLWVP